jgi:hypothetical protein
VSADCSVLFVQKASSHFLYYRYVVGTGRYGVSVVLFRVCLFVKEDVTGEFSMLAFLRLTLPLESKKSSYFYGTGYDLYIYF